MTLLPFGVVFVLFLVLGTRLLRSARETGGAELWLAVFFLAAAVAIPFRLAFLEPGLGVDTWAPTANAIGHLLSTLAICGFIVFVWRVFRGGDDWASGLAAGLIAAQLASLGGLVTFGGYRDERGTTVLICNAVRALPFAWGFLESLRYHQLMKRRLRMNLADSAVANRFGLFSIWTGALFLLPLSVLGVRLAVAQHLGDVSLPTAQPVAWAMPIVRGIVLICGAVSFGALWLSFFPPKTYLARLQRSSAEA